MRRRIGEVWFLPPDSQPGGDEKARRHVLLTESDEGEGGILAYASTKTTETAFGAVSLHVRPHTSPNCGFTRPTRVYPGRLVAADAEAFLRRTGRLVGEQPQLRDLLRTALGVGTGPAYGTSWRGKLVRMSEPYRKITGITFGLVLTEHRYSARRRYQIIVPVSNADEVLPVGHDLLVKDRSWAHAISAPDGVVLATSEIHSVYHREQIDSWTGAVADDETLAELEAKLVRLFEL